MKNIKKGFFIYLITLLLFTSDAKAGNRPPSINTYSDGIAVVTGGNTASARKGAIDDALNKAVEQAVSAVISRETIAQNDHLLSDQIYFKAAQYAQNYRIISEKIIGNLYQVSVEASISTENLTTDLLAVGIFLEEDRGVVEEITIRMVISGIESYLNYAKFKEMLQNRVAGVDGISEKRFSAGVANIEVRMRGSTQGLADKLTMIDYEGFTVDIMDISEDSMDVTIVAL